MRGPQGSVVLAAAAMVCLLAGACLADEVASRPAAGESTSAPAGAPAATGAPASEPAPVAEPSTTPASAPASAPAPTTAPTAATRDSNAAASKPVPPSQRAETIEKYIQYYLDMYSSHLKSGDWMARAMGVISLAGLDDPRATDKLVEVMKKDALPVVRVYAWEALHGRQGRLSPPQRTEWVREGLSLFDKDLFRGEMRPGVVGLIEEGGPTEVNRRRFGRLFASTSSINPADIRTLWAMGDALSRWRDPVLIRKMIECMGDVNEAYRAEVVLGRLNSTIPSSRTMYLESSQFMWGTTQKRWADWYAKSGWKGISPKDAPRYTGVSRIMPAGDVIRDTADPKWRKDLELKKFRLDQLDVGIVLDTTASMAGPLEWVKADVVKMMRMFDLISREPRIGVTLFRDFGDKYVTRSFPLTGNADALAAMLRKEGFGGGGDIPEAVYEGLDESVNRQRWSTAPNARKVIVLVSDAPPHEKSLSKIEKLTTAAVQKGFLFYAVKVRTSKWIEQSLKLPNYDPGLATYDKIAAWGGGKSVWVQFWNQSSSGRWQFISQPLDEDHSPRVIFRDVLKFALEDGYKDRVDPFVRILLEYIEEPLAETRVAFAKAPPSRGSSGRPSNPQMNR